MDYNQDFEAAKKWYKIVKEQNNQQAIDILEQLFPKLKKNEDERIKNLIYCLIRDRNDNGKLLENNGVTVEEALAWLEKQGTSYTKRDVDNAFIEGIAFTKEQLEKQGEQKHKFIIGDIISNGKVVYRVDNIVKNAIGQDCYFLVNIENEKNGIRYLQVTNSEGKTHNYGEITWLCEQVDAKFEKKFVVDFKAEDWYVSKVDGKIRNIYHSVDKVEPKFHEGDIIQFNGFGHNRYTIKNVCGLSHYINTIGEKMDMSYTDANFEVIEDSDKNKLCRAWSEEDDYNVQCLVAKANCDIQKGNVGRNEELIDWLKSLRNRVKSQPDMVEALRTEYEKGRADTIAEMKSSWSEEDEKMLEGIVNTVKDVRCQSLLSEIEIYDDYIDWLESIKQRIGG